MINSSEISNIVKKYSENKASHVYLVETNDIDSAMADIKNLIIEINKNNENNVSALLEAGNCSSIKYIYPDGLEIKSEQIHELISFCSRIPIYTNENYFIICECDKLNKKSGNSLLKLIEEPDINMLGFFLTSNINNVMDTIKSRCQIIRCFYKCEINNDFSGDVIEYYKNMIESLDLIYNKEIVDKYKTRDEILNFLNDLVKYINNLENVSNIMLKKNAVLVNLITDAIYMIGNNVNINLSLDKLLIEASRLI